MYLVLMSRKSNTSTNIKQSKRRTKTPVKDATQTEYNPQSYADKFKG